MLRAVIQTAVDTIKHRKDQLHQQGHEDIEMGADGNGPGVSTLGNLDQFVELNLGTARSSRKPSTAAVSNASEQANQEEPMGMKRNLEKIP